MALSKLHCEGKNVVDGAGRRVFLRGVNFPSLEWGYGSLHTGRPELYQDAIWANIAGVFKSNFVRLPFAMDLWLGDVNGYRSKIDQIVDLAEKHGVYVLLDCHQEFYAAARGPIPSDIDAWVAMWTTITQRYLGRTNLLFDIYNEPYTTDAVWISAAQRCVNAIRAIDDRIIVVSANHYGNGKMQWIQTTPFGTGITGGNIIYSLHWYQHYTPISDVSTDGIKKWLTDMGWKWILDNNVAPIILGEGGVTDTSSETEYTWFTNILSILNEWEQGYTAWAYYTTFSPLVEPDWMTPTRAGNMLIDAILEGFTPISPFAWWNRRSSLERTIIISSVPLFMFGIYSLSKRRG